MILSSSVKAAFPRPHGRGRIEARSVVVWLSSDGASRFHGLMAVADEGRPRVEFPRPHGRGRIESAISSGPSLGSPQSPGLDARDPTSPPRASPRAAHLSSAPRAWPPKNITDSGGTVTASEYG